MGLRQRAAFAAAGLLALITGSVAVFVAENNLGAVALVIVGAIGLTISIVGLVPLRISVRDVDLDFVDALVDSAGTANAEQIVEQAEALLPPPVAEAARSRVQHAFEYERAVWDALRRVLGAETAISRDVRVANDALIDGLVTRGNQLLAVEIKWLGGSAGATISKRVYDMISRSLRYPAKWLLITDSPLPGGALARLTERGISHAVWRDDRDDRALAAAVQAALERQ